MSACHPLCAFVSSVSFIMFVLVLTAAAKKKALPKEFVVSGIRLVKTKGNLFARCQRVNVRLALRLQVLHVHQTLKDCGFATETACHLSCSTLLAYNPVSMRVMWCLALCC